MLGILHVQVLKWLLGLFSIQDLVRVSLVCKELNRICADVLRTRKETMWKSLLGYEIPNQGGNISDEEETLPIFDSTDGRLLQASPRQAVLLLMEDNLPW